MSLKPGTSQTVTRTTGNGASLSGIGTVDKSVTKDPSTPLEYGRQHSDSTCLLYTSPSPRDATLSRMPSSA